MSIFNYPVLQTKASMIETAVIHDLVNKDKWFLDSLNTAKKNFECIERYNKLHYRLKIEAIKNELVDEFIVKYVIKRDITLKLISKLIKDFWKKKKSFITNYQAWLYFNYDGADKFSYSQIARDYYIKTGEEPYQIRIK